MAGLSPTRRVFSALALKGLLEHQIVPELVQSRAAPTVQSRLRAAALSRRRAMPLAHRTALR